MNESGKIRCLVIDDEEAAIDVLQHFISKLPYLVYSGGVTSPLAALEIIRKEEIELVFVDVQMPEISGLDLIRNIKSKCKVVLTTAYSEYALDGFELDVADYLLKPISFARFLKAVEKVVQLMAPKNAEANAGEASDDYILVKGDSKGKFLKIDTADIDYIEGMKNYAAIVCRNKKITSLVNLKDLEEKLSADKFIRVHKSFIISIQQIVSIEGNTIRLKDHPQANIPIGESYKALFLEKLKTRLIS